MASKYLYMDKHFKLCCVQRSYKFGKYYIETGDKRHSRAFYETAEEAQSVLDALAKEEGWQNV